MKGHQIKRMLQDMRLVLCNGTNGRLDADYHISARGVPYVSVVVNGQRYQFVYFGRGRIFRIFDAQQNHVDIKERNDVIDHFVRLSRDGEA